MIPISFMISFTEDENDRAFMKDLYVRHRDVMYGVAYKYLRDYQDAHDAVAEAVVRLIDKTPELRKKDCCVLRPYVVSTVVRASLNVLKKRKGKYTPIPTDPAELDAAQPLEDPVAHRVFEKLENDALIAALERLPEKERDLLCWKYFDMLSDEEIAAFLGIGKDSVRTYLTRARRRLYELLKER